MYLGRDGTKSEVTEAYALKDGTVEQVYCFIPEPGQQVFTSSGTFTVPKGVKSVDVFLCGGGPGGLGSRVQDSNGSHYYIGSGGGGGYTKTVKSVSVAPRSSYNIIVGSGGNVGSSAGGASSALGYSISGGSSGKYDPDSSSANGGSGGGVGGMRDSSYWSSAGWMYGGNDGSNGSNGYYSSNSVSNALYTSTYAGSKGQGTTTRAFGESSGTLYAGGGGSGANDSKAYTGGSGGGGNGYAGYPGTSNKEYVAAASGTFGTGGGGGGSYYAYSSSYNNWAGNGGSGIAIIRWGY